MASMEASSSDAAFERFKTENDIKLLDLPYKFNKAADNEIRQTKPWRSDPHYFDKVKISTLALLKMVTHARSGGDLEIMGMLQGRVEAHTFYVVDVFGLPVEGTETRVNAQTEAYEYMTRYADLYNRAGHMEKVIGWYHSHPGYGCWLSGIDVETQHLNQQFTEPFLAIVVDPVRTLSSGKVDIGAFRTYPDGFVPSSSSVSGKFIPMHKADDFGHHCNRYYQLDVSYYMSTMDTKLLKYFWNSYWVQTLSGNKLSGTSAYLNSQLSNIGSILQGISTGKEEKATPLLNKCGDDSRKLVTEAANGLLQEYFKRSFFTGPSDDNPVCEHQDVELPSPSPTNAENE
jgi:COP9 signalosome complex subunit 5